MPEIKYKELEAVNNLKCANCGEHGKIRITMKALGRKTSSYSDPTLCVLMPDLMNGIKNAFNPELFIGNLFAEMRYGEMVIKYICPNCIPVFLKQLVTEEVAVEEVI